MKNADEYIERVLAHLPHATPQREQSSWSCGHIEERLENGLSVEDVLHQLGDPVTLAESYLNAVPLVSAPLGRRILAKLIDAGMVAVAAALMVLVVKLLSRDSFFDVVVVVAMALFTAKKQRAFELLSQTRVVLRDLHR